MILALPRPVSTLFLRLPLLALVGVAFLAACAEETPPAYSVSFPASGTPGGSAYDTPRMTPLGAEPAPTVGEARDQASPAAPQTPLGASPAPPTGGIRFPVTARFVEGRPDLIEVSIRDAQPTDRVELVAPDGTVTAAYQLDRERVATTEAAPSGFNFGVGVTGGSSSGVQPSVGIGFPIFGRTPTAQPREEVRSVARIKVADMAAYRADWQRWIVRILFGTKGPSPRKMEMAAPAPPGRAG